MSKEECIEELLVLFIATDLHLSNPAISAKPSDSQISWRLAGTSSLPHFLSFNRRDDSPLRKDNLPMK